MKISDKGIDFIKSKEAFYSKPYLDSVGVPTIGYGTTYYLDNKRVTLKDKPITEVQATILLKAQIDNIYAAAVNKAIKVPLSQNEYDALVSFTYNVGINGMASSTLVRLINKGVRDADVIRKWFLVWNKGTIKGKKVKINGLTNRRNFEADLFIEGKY